jgi:glutamyl-tRNA reductase
VSLLVVGLSHRSAPLPVLERVVLDGPDSVRSLLSRLLAADHIAEAAALSTCNRLEVYADVSKFHGGVIDVTTALEETTGVPLTRLTDHLYVHYEDAAVAHAFQVACGLDSMAVGEAQILGQVRIALRVAQESDASGRVVGRLLQQALRVGKRAHAETGLDRAGVSLVEVGLVEAQRVLGPLDGAAALVLGAGAMAGVVVSGLRRTGVRELTVVSRTTPRARRLAESAGGRALPIAELARALAGADLVVASTGASGHLVDVATAAAARAGREGRPQVVLDLALPRDIDPAVAGLDGVRLIDLEHVGRHLASTGVAAELDQVRALVADEVSAFLAAQRAEAVAPTVVDLRAHARSVVDGELSRMEARLGELDAEVRAELAATVNRVVDKLLHTPTVRMKQLAGEPGGRSYAEALRQLFDLDGEQVAALTEVGQDHLARPVPLQVDVPEPSRSQGGDR